jgi:hypothetical protein
MISSSRKGHYAQIVCIFLAVIALVVAIGGCAEGGVGDDYYVLTIASTYGGSVATPGEGEFFYATNTTNTTVELVAEPDAHHHFVNWTGDVDTIGNITAAATNITMSDSYSIVANFELDEGWYSLTIFSNYGGSVAEPGEGYFAYAANTTVDLVAEPLDYLQSDYRFKEWTGDVDTIVNVNTAATNITMYDSYSVAANFEWFDITQVDAGWLFTVGLRSDGTVVGVGNNENGQYDVGNWTDITQVDAGNWHTVGLKSNGTVVAVGAEVPGEFYCGQCDVGNWTDIIQVSAGGEHTVGLRSDGTVVAVGRNDFGQCNVGNWTDIIQLSAGGVHTVGLRSDGTVVAVGLNSDGQCNVGNRTDIIQVAAGYYHTVGRKSDGTVVAVGLNIWGQCDVGSWTDIIQIAASAHTVGLKSDGTAVAVGVEDPEDPEDGYNTDYGQCDVGSWTNIIQVAVGTWHTVGLRSDGTVVALGDNIAGQCNVGS